MASSTLHGCSGRFLLCKVPAPISGSSSYHKRCPLAAKSVDTRVTPSSSTDPDKQVSEARFTTRKDIRPSINKFLAGNCCPVRELENGATSEGFVVLEGAIPSSLRGLLLRNGPNPDRNQPLDHYNALDGDGMIHAIWLGGGEEEEVHLKYKNKLVNTLGRKVEDLLGSNHREAVYPVIGELKDLPAVARVVYLLCLKSILPASFFGLVQDSGPWGDTGFGLYPKNVANVSVTYHHGKMLATWETGYPYEIEPGTLNTIGPYTFGGALKTSFPTHPKVDPETGEMVDVRYSLGSKPHCTVRVWSKEGKLLHEESVNEVLKPVIIHDTAITKNYTVIMNMPLVAKGPLEYGADGTDSFFSYKPDLGGRIGVMPRFGKEQDIKWFDVSPNFSFHTVNAFEEGDKVLVHSLRMEDAYEGWDPLSDPSFVQAHCHEYELGMTTGEAKERELPPQAPPLETPKVHPAFLGRKARFGFASGRVNPEENPLCFVSCEKFDLLSSNTAPLRYNLPNGCFSSEFVFAPKSPVAARTSETDGSDDGWLLAFVHNEVSDKSELHVVDGHDMGLVARVQLPARVPYGFDSSFIPANQLPDNYSLV